MNTNELLNRMELPASEMRVGYIVNMPHDHYDFVVTVVDRSVEGFVGIGGITVVDGRRIEVGRAWKNEQSVTLRY